MKTRKYYFLSWIQTFEKSVSLLPCDLSFFIELPSDLVGLVMLLVLLLGDLVTLTGLDVGLITFFATDPARVPDPVPITAAAIRGPVESMLSLFF